MAGESNGFRLITVHEDEDELVIHAGSGAAATASQAAAAPAEVTEAAAGRVEEAADEAVASAAPESSARQEALRRKAEELARAEEGLEHPHAFAKTHISVLVALALLVVAVVVYTLAMRA